MFSMNIESLAGKSRNTWVVGQERDAKSQFMSEQSSASGEGVSLIDFRGTHVGMWASWTDVMRYAVNTEICVGSSKGKLNVELLNVNVPYTSQIQI